MTANMKNNRKWGFNFCSMKFKRIYKKIIDM